MSSYRKIIKIEIQSEEQEAEITSICDWNNWKYELELFTAEGSSDTGVLETCSQPPRYTDNRDAELQGVTQHHDRDSNINPDSQIQNRRQIATCRNQTESQTEQEHEEK